MRVLICGSRDWKKQAPIWTYLTGLVERWDGCSEFALIQGGAKGADEIAKEWFRANETNYDPFGPFKHLQFAADWDKHGKGAGPVRNQKMLDEGKPDLVMAFKNNFNWNLDSGGTEDMVRRAKEAGIPVYVVSQA